PSAGRPSGEFASHVTERLRIMRDAARIDPAGLVPGALALRFTSRARYASWLVAAWLAGPEGAPHEARTLLPPPASIRRWVARAILPHGPELVLLAGELRARRLLVRWFARLDPRQTGAIRQTLRRDYLLPEEAEPTAGRQVPVGS